MLIMKVHMINGSLCINFLLPSEETIITAESSTVKKTITDIYSFIVILSQHALLAFSTYPTIDGAQTKITCKYLSFPAHALISCTSLYTGHYFLPVPLVVNAQLKPPSPGRALHLGNRSATLNSLIFQGPVGSLRGSTSQG